MTDQYAAWRHALAGNRLDFGPKGQPPSGFYRHMTKQGIEAVAIWRDNNGTIKCWRNIFGNGSKMTADEIDELLASCGYYPISHELFQDVTEHGKSWPPEHKTRLTMAEIKSGVAWTEELGRAKLGKDVEPDAAENPRAVMGNNQAPEEMTADKELAGRVHALETTIAAWLKDIGGMPRDKAEADTLANYATKFAEFKLSAESQHKAEKQPYMDAGREVDAKWFGIRDKAAALRKRVLEIADKWIAAERVRREEEARKANEEARRVAEEQAAQAEKETGVYEAPAAIEEVKADPVKIGTARTVSQRNRTVWRVKDLKAFSAYVASMETPPPDFIEVCNRLAHKLGSAGIKAPGIERNTEERAA